LQKSVEITNPTEKPDFVAENTPNERKENPTDDENNNNNTNTNKNILEPPEKKK